MRKSWEVHQLDKLTEIEGVNVYTKIYVNKDGLRVFTIADNNENYAVLETGLIHGMC